MGFYWFIMQHRIRAAAPSTVDYADRLQRIVNQRQRDFSARLLAPGDETIVGDCMPDECDRAERMRRYGHKCNDRASAIASGARKRDRAKKRDRVAMQESLARALETYLATVHAYGRSEIQVAIVRAINDEYGFHFDEVKSYASRCVHRVSTQDGIPVYVPGKKPSRGTPEQESQERWENTGLCVRTSRTKVVSARNKHVREARTDGDGNVYRRAGERGGTAGRISTASGDIAEKRTASESYVDMEEVLDSTLFHAFLEYRRIRWGCATDRMKALRLSVWKGIRESLRRFGRQQGGESRWGGDEPPEPRKRPLGDSELWVLSDRLRSCNDPRMRRIARTIGLLLGGCTKTEVSGCLGVDRRTISRDWKDACQLARQQAAGVALRLPPQSNTPASANEHNAAIALAEDEREVQDRLQAE